MTDMAKLLQSYLRRDLEPWQRELLDRIALVREQGRTFAGIPVSIDRTVRPGTFQLRSDDLAVEYDSATGRFSEIQKGP